MIRAIAFDLDDTLIDTHRLLVPAAAREACEAMIALGLNLPLERCLQMRAEMAVGHSHRDIFRLIAERAGAKNSTELGDVGAKTFYNPRIPKPLPLLEGATDVLTALSGKYRLFLVTIGNPNAQRLKVDAAELGGRFEELFLVDGFKGEKKGDAFAEILKRGPFKPEELLAVGNRRSQEIRAAKTLGAKTCFFKFGEYADEPIRQSEDNADWTIERWKDFARTCRL